MLKEIVKATGRKVYVHLPDDETGKRFLVQTEREGFTFGDGVLPTSRRYEEIMAVHPEGTICYVGAYGRMAYGCGAVDKLEFKDMIASIT